MRILKFGGTSVKDADAIKRVISIVSQRIAKERLGVVVSAMGGVTDQLIDAATFAQVNDKSYLERFKTVERRHLEAVQELIAPEKQDRVTAELRATLNVLENILHGIYLLQEITPRSMDMVSSFGERLSAYLISEAFQAAGVDAHFVDCRHIIRTDSMYGGAKVDAEKTYANIQQHFKDNKNSLPVITGFIASDANGVITTLGRGGSDLTASLFAAALDAEQLEIWTDVDGVLSADPRIVNDAVLIEELSYEEAMELSYFGAKVIYPPTIQPTYAKQIPIAIKNTFAPEAKGTTITTDAKPGDHAVKGVSTIVDVSLLTISGSGMVGVKGVAQRLFGVLAQAGINVIMISQASSEHTISIAIRDKQLEAAQVAIQAEFFLEQESGLVNALQVQPGMTILSVVGQNMKGQTGISGTLFGTLGKNGINIYAIAQGSSELNISVVIEGRVARKATSLIHEAFFLVPVKALHVYLIGTGTVSKALIQQVATRAEKLKNDLYIDIKLVGITNSRKMLVKDAGLTWSNALDTLDREGEQASLEQYIAKANDLDLRNTVFVDCTASEIVSSHYSTVLNSNFHLVTPNKIASSGPYEGYKELKNASLKRGVRFLFETNVGAGLPVISTLNDLVRSGDKVHRIEAILSGTMNYLFNTVSADNTISTVVKRALEDGYTEPDPRIDLSGKDMARKIVILAREAGHRIELDDVVIDAIVPSNLIDTDSMDDFWEQLEDYNTDFESERSKVEARDEIYRAVASFEDGKAIIKLATYPKSHPFYAIEGTDNIVLYYTERYPDMPLVVKGAGAGAEVTAAGVFADIIRIAS